MLRKSVPADYPGCAGTVAEVPAAELKPVSWSWADAVVTLVGSIVLSLVAGLLFLGFDLPIGWGLLIGATVPWLALAGWPVFATKYWGNGPKIDLGFRLRLEDIGWGIVAGIASLVVGTVVAFITVAIVGPFDSAAGDVAQRIADSGDFWQLWLLGLIALIGAPIVEELAFRGMLWAGLRRAGWGAWATGIAVTIAFALFHFEPVRIGVLLAIGAVLAYTRYRTESLGAGIVGHAINNLPGAIGIVALGS